MKRSEQGGAIVGFLVASVILALLLVGGVYALRHHPDWVAANPPSSVSAPGSSSTKQSSGSESSKPSKSSDSSSKNTAPAPSSDNSSSDTSGSTAPSSPSSNTAQSPSSSTTDSTDSASTSGQSPSTLPQTGPADTLWSILGLGFVTVAAAAYVRSCRLESPAL